MSAPDLRSTVLFDKALGCIAGAALGDAAGSAAKGADCGSGPDSGGGVAFGGHGSRAGLAFGGHGDETAMVEIVARMLVNTGGGATLDDWARAMRDNSPQFGKDSVFFISVQQVFSAVGRSGYPPRYTGLGTMPHSTGAVAMGPVGIVNACNPWQAALQAYELATLLHVYDVGFCQDAAAAVAAAVAAACRKDATVAAVLDAAVDVILPLSGTEMADLIRQARQLAADSGDFDRFRAEVCGSGDRWLRPLPVDPRETVPVALAIFALAEGDVQQAVACAARFGRAADAIGAIAGTVSGAFSGAGSISPEWLAELQGRRSKHETLATGLVGAARGKLQAFRASATALRSIAT
jgi:ADP-ribosylglycohydrolase